MTAEHRLWSWPADSASPEPEPAVQFPIDDVVVMTLDENLSHIAMQLNIDGIEHKYALTRVGGQ